MPDDETLGLGSLSLLRQPATCVQTNKQTTKIVYLGRTVCGNIDLTVAINRRVLLVKLRSRRYSLTLYDQPTAAHRSGMLKAEVMETMLYDECVTWSPTVPHLAILRTAHHRFLLRCVGWNRKPRHGYHMLSYPDALARTVCENVETTVRKRRGLFAGFVARMGNERLPKRVMYGELEGGKGSLRGQERD